MKVTIRRSYHLKKGGGRKTLWVLNVVGAGEDVTEREKKWGGSRRTPQRQAARRKETLGDRKDNTESTGRLLAGGTDSGKKKRRTREKRWRTSSAGIN